MVSLCYALPPTAVLSIITHVTLLPIMPFMHKAFMEAMLDAKSSVKNTLATIYAFNVVGGRVGLVGFNANRVHSNLKVGTLSATQGRNTCCAGSGEKFCCTSSRTESANFMFHLAHLVQPQLAHT